MDTTRKTVLDTFENLSGWAAIASGQAKLGISRVRDSMAGPYGLILIFAEAKVLCCCPQTVLASELPESYSFNFQIRGDAPSNMLRDQSHGCIGSTNVSALPCGGLRFSESVSRYSIDNSQIDFGLGPWAARSAGTIAAIEFVIAAGTRR